MLTVDDFQSILSILNSDRLSIRGNEALPLAKLIQKLAMTIDAARRPPETAPDADSPGLTE